MGIINVLKKIEILRKIKNCGEEQLGKYFPKYLSNVRFKRSFGRKANYDLPSTLNDKLMYYKFNLYWENKLVALCADKYGVRKYIEECGCPEILNPLLGVWDRGEDIDWDTLPGKFALKCNHGSGYNIICKDKVSFDKDDAIRRLNEWMDTTYGYINAEQGIYSGIERKIIAEKYIETPDNLPPNDYKFFCSYGKVYFLFVACDRYQGKTKFDYYYPNWQWIPVKNGHPNKGATEKPSTFDKMIEYAERLSKPFPLVRVDFYSIENEVIFGELTFTHFGCVTPFDPQSYDETLGGLLPDVKDARDIRYDGNLL